MNFNKHYNLEGKHAFLSPSNYHWLNDDEEKLTNRWNNAWAKERGTALHQLACDAITYGVRFEENGETLNMYVNDCIDDGLDPEVVLYFTDNAFGTADGISFDGNVLRIYDLKTGKTPASMKQLEIYAAFFCLEYEVNPNEVLVHLRIYQSNEILVLEPEPSEIWDVMDHVIWSNGIVDKLKTTRK